MMSLDSSAIITLCITKILKPDYRGFILSAVDILHCTAAVILDSIVSDVHVFCLKS